MTIFLLQILFGSLIGWLISKSRQQLLSDMLLGVIGTFAASLGFNAFGMPGVTGYNLYSFFVAAMGSLTIIWLGWSVQNFPLRKA